MGHLKAVIFYLAWRSLNAQNRYPWALSWSHLGIGHLPFTKCSNWLLERIVGRHGVVFGPTPAIDIIIWLRVPTTTGCIQGAHKKTQNAAKGRVGQLDL